MSELGDPYEYVITVSVKCMDSLFVTANNINIET